MSDLDIQRHSVHTLVFRSLKRSHDMFISDQMQPLPSNPTSDNIRLACKIRDGYKHVKERVEREVKRIEIETNTPATSAYNGVQDNEIPLAIESSTKIVGTHDYPSGQGKGQTLTSSGPNDSKTIQLLQKDGTPTFSTLDKDDRYKNVPQGKTIVTIGDEKMLVPRKAPTMAKPNWHPPWKLYRVISGHLGWVRCIAFEPGNEWFVTGANDRMIKIWDLASGQLKLSLTGHISSVRGLAVSSRQPYLFSCGEDKQVKCWDLEYNKVVRHYHGHLSAIYALDLHPTLDVLVTSGRDSTARVWDMRTKAQIHALTGHSNTVATVKCQNANPQVITGSHDSTIRLWDLVSGRSNVTLTNHKKSVRAIALHPSQYTMASASPDNIKQWKFPDGNFIQNCSGHNSIVNCLAVNQDGVMVSGGDNGSMHFFDWKTGYNFQRMQSLVQPGSLDSEAGIFAASFDHSGSRLLTGEADKSIKIYKEDDSASEETHPINWRPDILKRKRF